MVLGRFFVFHRHDLLVVVLGLFWMVLGRSLVFHRHDLLVVVLGLFWMVLEPCTGHVANTL
jgi:hypothetical protein